LRAFAGSGVLVRGVAAGWPNRRSSSFNACEQRRGSSVDFGDNGRRKASADILDERAITRVDTRAI
jgi:hypothetical protein